MSTVAPLRRLRLAHGFSQLQVAAGAGISLKTLQKIERGDVAGVKLWTVIRLAGALGCRAVDLVPAFLAVPRPPPPPSRARRFEVRIIPGALGSGSPPGE
jgi:transcriptional regulator with XRE-family HTH domain